MFRWPTTNQLRLASSEQRRIAMKKSEFFSIFGILLFVIGLHALEVKQGQRARRYEILIVTPAVNWDRERSLSWYDYKDEKGRLGRALSESHAKPGDSVVGTKKATTHIPGEMIFKLIN
jgi:hypothetical protein